MLIIYVDADACPVKDEIFRVAGRYDMHVKVAANSPLRVPASDRVQFVLCPGFGGTDDWIAEQAGLGDLVVTADIPLAARCLAKEALVLGTTGHPFTEKDIGGVLAMRDLMNDLRQDGTATGGPAPMKPKDRSRFLSKLDEMINRLKKSHV